MSLYRKSPHGVWYYDVTADGRRMRGSTGTADKSTASLFEQSVVFAVRRKAPRDRLLKLIDALFGEPELPDPPLASLAVETGKAAAAAMKRTSAKTAHDRELALARFERWCHDHSPNTKTLRAVDRRCAQAYAAYLAKSGLASKSIANETGILSAAWNLLRRSFDQVENPWPLARPGEIVQNRREAFTEDEVARLFAAADKIGHGWGLACRIAAATGLRFGDIARLDHEDIQGGVIRITPNKTRHSSGISVAVPLPFDLVALIGDGVGPLLPEMRREYDRVGNNHAFPFRKVMEAAGVEARGRTFHSFRHFFRTQLSRAGVSDEIAMKLGGWTQHSTADRYDHDGRSAEKVEAVNAAWRLLEQGKEGNGGPLRPRRAPCGVGVGDNGRLGAD